VSGGVLGMFRLLDGNVRGFSWRHAPKRAAASSRP
jgi:hypothetical protein